MPTPNPRPKNPYNRWYLTLIVLFGISVVAVFLLFRAYPYPWGLSDGLYLWVYSFLAVAFLVIMLRVGLKDLHRRKKVHGILSDIAERGLVRAIAERLIERRSKVHSPVLFLALLAALIMLLVFVLAANDLLFDQNVTLLGYFDRFQNSAPQADSSVRYLSCYTIGRGTESRLRLILKVTEDLKHAGAKVVVIRLPPLISRPYYRELVEKIQGTGVAALALEAGQSRVTWKTAHDRLWGLFRDSLSRPMGVLSASPLGSIGDPYRMTQFACFVPYGYFDEIVNPTTGKMGRDTMSDVVLEVLRKWNDYPETLRAVQQGRDIFFGSYRIPVSKTGLAIVRTGGIRFLRVLAGDDWQSDTSGYWSDSRYWGPPAADLSAFGPEIRGKIIVLGYHDAADELNIERFGEMISCASIISNAVRHDFFTVRDDLDLALTLLVSLLSVLIVLRFRPVMSVVVFLVLATLLVAGSVWLYLNAATVMEVIYPLAALVLSMVILPLAKISSEVQRAENWRGSRT